MLVGPCACGATHFVGEFILVNGKVIARPPSEAKNGGQCYQGRGMEWGISLIVI